MATITGLAARLSRVQAKLFAPTLERSQLQVKIALAERMDRELRALDEKYQSRTGADLEASINKMADRKSAVAETLGNITNALAKFTTIKTKLFEMRAEATAGNTATFDVAVQSLNYTVGGAVLYPNNLVGNTGQGSWGEKIEVVADGGLSTSVARKFLGTDYVIDMADGTRFAPDFENQVLRRGGTQIAFTSLNLQSIVGDTITFDDGTTTYSGTLRRGGGEVMSAWQYNDFAAQADKDAAVADINTAIRRMDEVERSYKANQATLNAIINRYSLRMEDDTKAYKAATEGALAAKHAERKAIRAKFDLTVNNLSLTANVNATYIQNIFLAEDPNKKQGLFDVIMGPS